MATAEAAAQDLTGACTYRDQFAILGDVGRSVAETELSLEGVVDGLQLALLFRLGRLLFAAVVTELVQFVLATPESED